MNDKPSAAMLCGAVIMDEFFAQAGGGVVVCPGSRSAPLAYAAHARAAQGGVTVAQGGVTVAQGSVRVCPDERSAAFFALGRAKASGRAAAVVTTSGTAAANLAPALLEARHAHVPLVAFTADRPASLVGTGANQTADQVGLFPGVAKLVIRVSSADNAPDAWRHAVRRAVVAAEGRLDRTPGPVHVNVELTPPLVGDPGPPPPARPFASPSPHEPFASPSPHRPFASPSPHEPFTSPAAHQPLASPSAHHPFASQSPHATSPAAWTTGPTIAAGRTVIVAGDLPPAQGARWAAAAARAHVPLLAEPSSNARSGPAALRFREALLDRFTADIDHVVVVGHPTLGRPTTALLSRHAVPITAVTEHGDWPDPGWAVTEVVTGLALEPADPAWLERWQAEDRLIAFLQDGDSDPLAGSAEDRLVAPLQHVDSDTLTGPAVAAAVLASLGPADNLILGASRPIRDADVAPIHPDPPAVYANRGLAGIDGTIATALGVAAATDRPTTALIGDLTALHDLTSLVLPTHEAPVGLRLVIADDNGGSIFGTLEYGRAEGSQAEALDRFFTAPHGIDLAAAATALGATQAVRVATLTQLKAALSTPWHGRHVIVARLHN